MRVSYSADSSTVSTSSPLLLPPALILKDQDPFSASCSLLCILPAPPPRRRGPLRVRRNRNEHLGTRPGRVDRVHGRVSPRLMGSKKPIGLLGPMGLKSSGRTVYRRRRRKRPIADRPNRADVPGSGMIDPARRTSAMVKFPLLPTMRMVSKDWPAASPAPMSVRR